MAALLTAADLMSLEQYARERAAIRARMIGYRATRRLQLGPDCTWSFEDRETVRYQVQEMLRTERIFEPAGIAEELAAYNPLIPEGRNLKATLLIEYPDPVERARRLSELRGIEGHSWLRIAGHDAVYAIADEDLERSNDEKTSAVHFLRFELSIPMIATLKSGATLAAGIDLPAYTQVVDPVPEALRRRCSPIWPEIPNGSVKRQQQRQAGQRHQHRGTQARQQRPDAQRAQARARERHAGGCHANGQAPVGGVRGECQQCVQRPCSVGLPLTAVSPTVRATAHRIKPATNHGT